MSAADAHDTGNARARLRRRPTDPRPGSEPTRQAPVMTPASCVPKPGTRWSPPSQGYEQRQDDKTQTARRAGARTAGTRPSDRTSTPATAVRTFRTHDAGVITGAC